MTVKNSCGRWSTVAMATAVVLGTTGAAAADQVRLTSLEWPPYSGESLPGGGTFFQSVETALAAVGDDVAVDFFPWNRAVRLGLAGEDYVGYGPEYFAEDYECEWSDPIGNSPVGFVQNVDTPIAWETVSDLTAYTIGVVQGYVNDGAEFDAMIASGALTVDAVADDLANVRKVAAGRIDAAVIDRNVLDFLVSEVEPDLAGHVAMNDHLLVVHDLYVCFAPTESGRAARDHFNEGLAVSR